jgi:hypothetical protein
MAHTRQAPLDAGFVLQVKPFKWFPLRSEAAIKIRKDGFI